MTTPVSAVQFLKTWWFLIAALGSMTVAGLAFGIELSLRVEALSETKSDDDLQWLTIRGNGREVIKHEQRLNAIEKVVTTQSLEDWGAFKNTVTQDHEALWNHITEHQR